MAHDELPQDLGAVKSPTPEPLSLLAAEPVAENPKSLDFT